jgi:hypothetical protein
MTASSQTPRRPLPPLPAERTAVAPYSWVRRHLGQLVPILPLISGFIAWGVGVLRGVDPVQALQQLGIPVAMIALEAMALAWTYLVYIPQRAKAEEATRQALLQAQAEEHAAILASHAEDRAAFLEGNREIAKGLGALVEQMKGLDVRLVSVEKAVRGAGEPTEPGAPAALREGRHG